MAYPQWATPARRNHLLSVLGGKYKGYCLKEHPLCQDADHHTNGRCLGHPLCPILDHYKHVYTKTEITAQPITPADVRAGRAVAYPSHGIGIVELAHGVSKALEVDENTERAVSRHVGATRVAVQHEELSDRYGVAEEQAIESWKAEDRDFRSERAKRESQMLHSGDQKGFGGIINPRSGRRKLDPVERLQWLDKKPEYILVGFGVGGHTMSRIAEIRIPGVRVHLFVDVASPVSLLSANKRKKVLKYGRKMPKVSDKDAHERCLAAVRQWWAR